MLDKLNPEIQNEEFLYRGIVDINWDYERNRPSSASFKDSKGVSVDRDNYRNDEDCIKYLLNKKMFFGVCKIITETVRNIEAYPVYKPLSDNIYHSEIHDSETRIEVRQSKAKKLRDLSLLVYKK